jgi:hypothetical protein
MKLSRFLGLTSKLCFSREAEEIALQNRETRNE